MEWISKEYESISARALTYCWVPDSFHSGMHS